MSKSAKKDLSGARTILKIYEKHNAASGTKTPTLTDEQTEEKAKQLWESWDENKREGFINAIEIGMSSYGDYSKENKYSELPYKIQMPLMKFMNPYYAKGALVSAASGTKIEMENKLLEKNVDKQ